MVGHARPIPVNILRCGGAKTCEAGAGDMLCGGAAEDMRGWCWRTCGAADAGAGGVVK